jgi:hypothetical protein
MLAEIAVSECALDENEQNQDVQRGREDFDPKLLAEKFASMFTNAEEIRRRMSASLTRNGERLRTQFDESFRSPPPATVGCLLR